MIHESKVKQSTFVLMMIEARDILKRMKAGELSKDELAAVKNPKALMNGYYKDIYECGPTRKKSKTTNEMWWTFNTKLAAEYLEVTPYMYAGGVQHHVLRFNLPMEGVNKEVRMKLTGPNEDGLLVAMELPTLTNGSHEGADFDLEAAWAIQEKWQAGQTVINKDMDVIDINAILKIPKKD